MRTVMGLLATWVCCGGCFNGLHTVPSRVSESVVAPAPVLLPSTPASVSTAPLAEAQPRFSLAPKGAYPGVVFVEMGRSPEVSSGILIVREKTYTFVDSAGTGSNVGWMDVRASYDRRHIWAIMDSVVESPGWELRVLHSADGGASWSLAAPLHKPYYLSGMHELRMRADGSGELVVLHLDGPRNVISDVPEGYYTYFTKDWGDSWSQEPVFTPDILVAPDFTAGSRALDAPPLSEHLEDLLKTGGATP